MLRARLSLTTMAPIMTFWSALGGVALLLLWLGRRLSSRRRFAGLPRVGIDPGFLGLQMQAAKDEFFYHGQQLLEQGYAKVSYPSPSDEYHCCIITNGEHHKPVQGHAIRNPDMRQRAASHPRQIHRGAEEPARHSDQLQGGASGEVHGQIHQAGCRPRDHNPPRHCPLPVDQEPR